tara:strand:- start:1244 stop:1648 length:405 start_codon:yes stop_codon:yes gene_type:complete
MASTLKINTLTGVTTAGSIAVTGEGNSTTTNLQQGLAKGWVNFDTNDNPPVANDSFNVSSLTDDDQEVEINMTNAMSNSVYSPTSSGGNSSSNPSNRNLAVAILSSSVINCEMFTTNNAAAVGLHHVTWHGDLA